MPVIACSPPLMIARAIIGTLTVNIPAMASLEMVLLISAAAFPIASPSMPASEAFIDLALAIVPT